MKKFVLLMTVLATVLLAAPAQAALPIQMDWRTTTCFERVAKNTYAVHSYWTNTSDTPIVLDSLEARSETTGLVTDLVGTFAVTPGAFEAVSTFVTTEKMTGIWSFSYQATVDTSYWNFYRTAGKCR